MRPTIFHDETTECRNLKRQRLLMECKHCFSARARVSQRDSIRLEQDICIREAKLLKPRRRAIMYFQKTKVRFLQRALILRFKSLARADVSESSFQMQNVREKSLRAAAETATSEVDGSALRACRGSGAHTLEVRAETASFCC